MLYSLFCLLGLIHRIFFSLKTVIKQLGLHSLLRRRLRADVITTFKIFTGLLDIYSSFFRPPPPLLEGTPRREPPPKERVGIFGEGFEIVEWAPCFRRNSSFRQYFQETVGESLDNSLSPTPPLTEHSHHT